MHEVYILKKIAVKFNPHIVRLVNAWAIANPYYEVYIEFEKAQLCLYDVVYSAGNKMSLIGARRLMKHVLSGLVYLHENRIIHGDIKLENVLLKNGIAQICDFEVSRETDKDGLIPFMPLNDKRYQSLELLFQISRISFAIDMYAFGCMVVRMMCGNNTVFETFDSQEQLDNIYMICGPIDQWYFNNCPNRPMTNPRERDIPHLGLAKCFPFLPKNDHFIDLMERLFETDQYKRISSLMASNHPFFFQELKE
jgi:serine/threonine protein kinase